MRSTPAMVSYLLISQALMACGIMQKAENDSDAANSGLLASVKLAFSSYQESSLQLAELPDDLRLDSGLVLTYAKFNIAKIKIKGTEQSSSEEVSQEQQESAIEAVAVQEFETAMGEISSVVELDLAKPDGAGARPERAPKRDGLAQKKSELAAKEQQRLESEVADDSSTHFKGPYLFNAISGKIEGEVPSTQLGTGEYSRVEFQLKRNFTASDDEAILGNVFAIRGTVLRDGTATPFEIDWHSALNFRLTGASAFTVAKDAENSLLIDLNVKQWFAGIDLSAATIETDGTIYINKKSNQSIMRQLRRNIMTSTGFGKDADGDGKLGQVERKGRGQDTEESVTAP